MTANAVNDQGEVVGDYQGFCTPDCGGAPEAWMYQQSSGASDELIFDPSETSAAAYGINNNGVIVGEEANQGVLLPVYWTVTGGSMVLTGEYSSSAWAVAVNDSGTILGQYSQSGTPGSAALLWTPPEYGQTVLPGLECDYCTRVNISTAAINNSGTAVGSSASTVYVNGTLESSGLFAVEWQSGTVTNLGSLQSSDSSAAYGINDSGDVVGSSVVGQTSGAPSHAFLYHLGAMTDLGTLPGDLNSSANSINDSGQIVGVSSDAVDTQRAFLYENGQMYDLNSLIAATDPLHGLVTLQDAVSISSNGLIAVNGTDSRDTTGSQYAFLLVPSQ